MNLLRSTLPHSLTLTAFFVILCLAQQSHRVEAWITESDEVSCLEPGNDICIGSAVLGGPFPVKNCNQDGCNFTYAGGWSWSYSYVVGLADGTDTYAMSEEEKSIYFTGESMKARVEDDRTTCSVFANGEECCSCELCEFVELGVSTLSADCTNVAKGKKMVCEPLMSRDMDSPRLFYPFGDVDHESGDCPVAGPALPSSPAPTLSVTNSPFSIITTTAPSSSPSPTSSPTAATSGSATGSPAYLPTTGPTQVPVSSNPTHSPTAGPTSATFSPSYLRSNEPSAATSSEDRVLPIDSYFVFEFFQGDGREPSATELQSLLEKIIAFFLERLQSSESFPSFSLDIINAVPHYDTVNSPDEFKLDFETLVTLPPGFDMEQTHHEVNKLIGDADFRDFLLSYVRETGGVFVHTFKVFYKGVSRNGEES